MKRLFALLAAAALGLSACSSAAPSGASQATASSAAFSSSAAPAQSSPPVDENWTPQQKITMLVAYREGSSTDVGARLLCSYAERYLGQSVEVRNIAANSGQTAWETLASAEPDGYTLGFINMPNIFTAIDNGGNFTIQDFAPICTHVIETSVVVVPDNSPYTTLDELIEANQAASESDELLRAATNGVQASNDIGAAMLAYASGGWHFRHVAYGSTSDQLNALLYGECDWSVAKVSDVLSYLDGSQSQELAEQAAENAEAAQQVSEAANGEETETPAEAADEAEEATPADESAEEYAEPTATGLRVLAVFDTDRCAELPDVPTMQELGYPTGWYGSTRAVVAPAGTDPTIIEFYAQAFEQAMQDPECIAAHTAEGLTLTYMGPEALAERIDDRARFNSSLLPKLFES